MTPRRLAHYEIHELLGKGGMGEVYRATDTKLQRQVALKLLPPQLMADPERQARFSREARTLASLHHPNIASIHGLEEADGVRFLVLELAEGEDLASRLARGPLPLEEVQSFAEQIIEGLEAAHEQNIVHRDLKPANLRVSAAGQIKILDFGLARAIAGGMVGEEDPSLSPTITAAHTQAGTILGTAAYMSPEQARGKPVDKRADIWAFGAILWEMLTGARLFGGETITDVLAAVVREEPDFGKLPPGTSPGMRQLLLRCLQRDPKQRLRDIGEARLLLKGDPMLSGSGLAAAPPAPASSRWLRMLPWALFVLALALLLPRALDTSSESAPAPLRRFEFRTDNGFARLSPDGSAFLASNSEGIWLREFANLEPRRLRSAEELGASRDSEFKPCFSPDGKQIVYFADGRLWRMPTAGGPGSVVCLFDTALDDCTWTASDWIVLAAPRRPLYRVRAQGGTPEVLIPLGEGELDFHNPSLLPDGESFVYSVHRTQGVDTIEMFVNGQRKIVLREEMPATELTISPQLFNFPCASPTGHLIFQRDKGNQGVWAVEFDATSGETRGAPFLVQAEARQPSVSRDGLLLFASRGGIDSGELVLVTREGKVVRRLGDQHRGASGPAFSPDGKSLAFIGPARTGSQIFCLDLATDEVRQITADDLPKSNLSWIPGTSDLAFAMPDSGCRSIFTQPSDGSRRAERLVRNGSEQTFLYGGSEWVYTLYCQAERGIARMLRGQAPQILRASAGGVDRAELSPDGRWLLWRDWASGDPMFYVSDYPAMAGTWKLGASDNVAAWGQDGKSIYMVREGRSPELVVIGVDTQRGLALSTPRVLFPLQGGEVYASAFNRFAISPDGQLIALPTLDPLDAQRPDVVLVENWLAAFQNAER